MKRVRALIPALAVVASACVVPAPDSGGEDPPNPRPPSPASTTTLLTTTTTLPPTTTTTEAVEPDARPVLGWLSPAGMPLSIIATEGRLHTVLTPCGNEAPLVRGTPLYQTTVVLDPGHGGPVDTGAWGPNGLREKDVNLAVAKAAEILLRQQGISVVLTRTADYPTRLWVRSALADTLQAELMVSIHHNAPSGYPSADPGTDVFVQHGSDESARLGGLLWRNVTEAFSIVDVSWTAAGDSGVMTVLNTEGTDAYGMLRNPETPTALIELGYISNRSEAAFFASDIYPFYAARAVVNAIVEYLYTNEPGVELGAGRTFNPRPGLSAAACEDPTLG